MNWISFRVSFHTGKDLLEKKQFQKAAENLERAVSIRPEDLEASLLLARAKFGLGEKDAAKNLVFNLIQQAPSLGAPYFCLAGFLRDEHDVEGAIEQYEKTVVLDPKNEEAWYELGKLSLRVNRPERALEAFQEVTTVDPFITPYQLSLLQEKLKLSGKK